MNHEKTKLNEALGNAFPLRDYQDKAVADTRTAFREAHRLLLVAPTGAGKCLGRDTPVRMFDGTVKMVQDVVVGDLLLGPDSRPRLVTSTTTGQEMLYRVTPVKGEPYTVNESHILSLKLTTFQGSVTAGDGNKYRSGDIVNICVMDYLASSSTFKHVAKGWRVAVDYPVQETHQFLPPYILGVWLGDGTARRPEVSTVDGEVIDALAEYAISTGMIVRSYVHPNNSCPTYCFINNDETDGHLISRKSRMKDTLRHYGLIQNKHIPYPYLVNSRENRLQLLAGLLDTDGYLHHGYMEIAVKEDNLANDVLTLARSLGFAAYDNYCKKTCTNTGVSNYYHRITISGDLDEVPCRVMRRQAGQRKQKKNVLVTGISVDPIGLGDYYGFELSGPDRLFLLGDFTVTHNTVLFSHIARQSALKGKKVLILAHRDQLIKQASAKLRSYGVEHGIIMAAFTPALYRNVQVASVQTLVRRLDKIKIEFDLIIIDEAHLSIAKSYISVLERWPNARVMGVTGSPCRLDGRGLGREFGGIYDVLVEGPSIKWMIDQGYLVRPVVYASSEKLDFSGVKKVAGEYESKALSEMMDKPVITGNAIAEYKRICPGVPAVAWCANVSHAQHVAAEFSANGIPAVALSGEATSAERDKALADLASGKIKVLSFAMLLVEGVDCPAIGAVIMLRPTMSLASYLQVIGRGLRTIYQDGFNLDTKAGRHAAIAAGPKGPSCYIIDHAGLTFKHGFADEEREWSLEGVRKRTGKKKDQDRIDIKQCPKCYFVHTPEPACPKCGHVYEIAGREIKHVEGELQEITPEMRESMQRTKRLEQGNARSVEDMVRNLGYSRERATKILQARQEKETLRNSIIADLQNWREMTGQTPLGTFGIAISDLRTYKPKQLKEFREKFDAHKSAYNTNHGTSHEQQSLQEF